MEKRWREPVETLEAKEPRARNSPEKPKRSTEDRDRVSLLPESGSKCRLSCEGAVLERKPAFFTARSRLREGRGSARLRGCLPAPACLSACLPKLLLRSCSAPSSVLGWGDAEPRGICRGPGHPKSVPSSCGTRP